MFDFDAQTEFADAATQLMRSYALVTAQTISTSAFRGLMLWSQMLRPAGERPAASANPFEAFWRTAPGGRTPSFSDWMPGLSWNPYAAVWSRPAYTPWMPLADWASWSRAYWPAWNIPPAASTLSALSPSSAMTRPALRLAPAPIYASYRTAGGHAVAQIVVPADEPVISGTNAKAVFTPMQSMLGVWRAALGA